MSTVRKPGRPKSAVCGTISGRQVHIRNKEEPCQECKTAFTLYQKGRTQEVRDYIENYKLTSGCVDCGYNSHSHALDFDHLKDKKFSIGISITKRIEEIIEEISKCEVVCANCHRVRTATRRANVLQSKQ